MTYRLGDNWEGHVMVTRAAATVELVAPDGRRIPLQMDEAGTWRPPGPIKLDALGHWHIEAAGAYQEAARVL